MKKYGKKLNLSTICKASFNLAGGHAIMAG